jgi:hypothetical protein
MSISSFCNPFRPPYRPPTSRVPNPGLASLLSLASRLPNIDILQISRTRWVRCWFATFSTTISEHLPPKIRASRPSSILHTVFSTDRVALALHHRNVPFHYVQYVHDMGGCIAPITANIQPQEAINRQAAQSLLPVPCQISPPLATMTAMAKTTCQSLSPSPKSDRISMLILRRVTTWCMPTPGIRDPRLRSYSALHDTLSILERRSKVRWNGFELSRPRKQRVESSIDAFLKQGYASRVEHLPLIRL